MEDFREQDDTRSIARGVRPAILQKVLPIQQSECFYYICTSRILTTSASLTRNHDLWDSRETGLGMIMIILSLMSQIFFELRTGSRSPAFDEPLMGSFYRDD